MWLLFYMMLFKCNKKLEKKKDGTLDIVRPTLSETEFLLVIEYSYSIW